MTTQKRQKITTTKHDRKRRESGVSWEGIALGGIKGIGGILAVIQKYVRTAIRFLKKLQFDEG